jgi:hypothetical protein
MNLLATGNVFREMASGLMLTRRASSPGFDMALPHAFHGSAAETNRPPLNTSRLQLKKILHVSMVSVNTFIQLNRRMHSTSCQTHTPRLKKTSGPRQGHFMPPGKMALRVPIRPEEFQWKPSVSIHPGNTTASGCPWPVLREVDLAPPADRADC